MAITYEKLMSLRSSDVSHRYGERETMLYALSIGMGRDPLNEAELPFVFEKYRLRTVPTWAIVVARQNLIYDVGLNVGKMLHGEQTLELHHPLPPAAELLADAAVTEVYDRGPDKGIIIQLGGTIYNAADRQRLISWGAAIFARGDGGIGGSTKSVPRPAEMPMRKPDLVKVAETRRDQALLYRLNGDRNLIHADPQLASSMGFKAPILHGACTYAIACREVLAHVCNYDHTRIRTFDVRFTSPVYPGEHVETAIWVDGDTVRFRSRVQERDLNVLDYGTCTLQPSSL